MRHGANFVRIERKGRLMVYFGRALWKAWGAPAFRPELRFGQLAFVACGSGEMGFKVNTHGIPRFPATRAVGIITLPDGRFTARIHGARLIVGEPVIEDTCVPAYTIEAWTCTRCKQAYPRTADYFCRDRKRPDGLSPVCLVCMRTGAQRWREAYPDRYRASVERARIKHLSPEYKARRRLYDQQRYQRLKAQQDEANAEEDNLH